MVIRNRPSRGVPRGSIVRVAVHDARDALRALGALGAVVSVAAPTCAWAQDARREATLDAVVVSASRSDAQLRDTPLHTTLITRDEIRASPAQSADQLLRGVPGLLLSGTPAFASDPTGANIKLRGMDKKALVLLDGVPLLDPFYSTIQWFRVPLSTVSSVEIVRGGGSSLWGNLAVAGVINFISNRRAGDEGEASASLGSMNTWRVAADKAIAIREGLSLSVAADAFETRGYSTVVPETRAAFWPGRGDSPATGRNLRVGAFFDPGPSTRAFVRAGYHEQNEVIGGYAFGSNRQRSPDFQTGLTHLFESGDRVSATAYAQFVHFDKFNGAGCHAGASFACGAPVAGAGATSAQQAGPELQYASSHDLNTYRERGGSLVYSTRHAGSMTGSPVEWQAGADVRAISGEDGQQTFRTPTPALPAPLRVQRTNDGAGAQTFAGVFGRIVWQATDPLSVTIGARIDRFSSADGRAVQTNYSNVAAPVPSSSMGGPVDDTAKTAFNPSLAARYDVSDTWSLRAAAYKGFRAPGLNNLYRSFGSGSITIANPLLGPETLTGQEIGADWRDGRNTLSVTAFRANVKNVVATYALVPGTVAVPGPVRNICGDAYDGTPNAACPGSVSFYTNGQDQRATGLELAAGREIVPRLQAAAYATLTRTTYTRTTTGDPTGVQLPLVPRAVVGGSLTWRDARWTHDIDLRLASRTTLSNLTVASPVTQGRYAVVGAATAYRPSERLELFASVVNLFDRGYSDSAANNAQSVALAMPRTLTVGVRVRI